MISIPLLAIINSGYGEDAYPNLALPNLVAITAYAVHPSWEFALIWGLGFFLFRAPALSKKGFKAFDGTPDQKRTAFFWLMGRSMYLLPTFVALGVYFGSVAIGLLGLASIGYGLIYSALGYVFGNTTWNPRVAEYLSGAFVGALLWASAEMIPNKWEGYYYGQPVIADVFPRLNGEL